ncbi:MAG: hypothetical protein QW550_01145 [Saccharolobus sp.]
MLCERCNKRDTVTEVGGRKLCMICSKDEIIKRIKREFYPNKILSSNDKVLFAYPRYLHKISDILKSIIINKIYKIYKLEYFELVVEPKNSINDEIWNLLINSKSFSEKNNIKKVILPFTSDFLMSYLIYSIIKQEFTYIGLLEFEYKINNISFLVPFYNTSILELRGFLDDKSYETKDEIFNEILKWELEALKENFELFHAFHNSRKLFQGNYKCENCGGIINSPVKYCSRCSAIFASHPY